MVECVLLQFVANINGIAVLQIQCLVSFAESDAADGCCPVGEVEFEVLACASDAPGVTVVDHIAGDEHRARIARTERLQMA